MRNTAALVKKKNKDTVSEESCGAAKKRCLIKSVSYLLSLTQGGMSWLLDSGQELGIWAFFVFQILSVFVGVAQSVDATAKKSGSF